MDDAGKRLDEATELLDGNAFDFVRGAVQGISTTVDVAKSCIAHPVDFAGELWDWLTE